MTEIILVLEIYENVERFYSPVSIPKAIMETIVNEEVYRIYKDDLIRAILLLRSLGFFVRLKVIRRKDGEEETLLEI